VNNHKPVCSHYSLQLVAAISVINSMCSLESQYSALESISSVECSSWQPLLTLTVCETEKQEDINIK